MNRKIVLWIAVLLFLPAASFGGRGNMPKEKKVKCVDRVVDATHKTKVCDDDGVAPQLGDTFIDNTPQMAGRTWYFNGEEWKLKEGE